MCVGTQSLLKVGGTGADRVLKATLPTVYTRCAEPSDSTRRMKHSVQSCAPGILAAAKLLKCRNAWQAILYTKCCTCMRACTHVSLHVCTFVCVDVHV